ncbi:hypothetical protein AGOR_G00243940 [Albula goreensis]|uniref:Uncharacterized protein n=1 Tax=Albula goreensis TaxID=1534307 RepID=A0A8T3CFE4_9TELE|nr:hypothetical protein AGOR_G00243940 [Albula goreensis]
MKLHTKAPQSLYPRKEEETEISWREKCEPCFPLFVGELVEIISVSLCRVLLAAGAHGLLIQGPESLAPAALIIASSSVAQDCVCDTAPLQLILLSASFIPARGWFSMEGTM